MTDRGPNQRVHRTTSSVWDRQGWNGSPRHLTLTRVLIGVGGGALAVQGLRNGGWRGRALASLGGSLAWWAITGEGNLDDAKRWFNGVIERRPGRDDDSVTEASDESFPASDAPSFTPTMGAGAGREPARH